MKLQDVAERIGARLVVPGGVDGRQLEATSVAPIERAGPGDISFIVSAKYEGYLTSSQAAAVIVASAKDGCKTAQLIHRNPYWAFARVAQLLLPQERGSGLRAKEAFVDPSAQVGEGTTVYPLAYIGAGARVGARCILYPGVFVGAGAEIGDDSVLRANVVIEAGCKVGARALVHAGAVIGADGFGFAPGEGEIAKIPQVGIVVLGDDVEVGPNCTIDRAAMDETRIGSGTKLDSHVHIGHNTQIGRNCMLSAFVGVAGSSKIGDWFVAGGHAGVSGHIEVCDRVMIGAMAGVIKPITESGTYMGFPATAAGEWRRQQVRLRRLADVEERLKKLEAAAAANSPKIRVE